MPCLFWAIDEHCIYISISVVKDVLIVEVPLPMSAQGPSFALSVLIDSLN